MLWPRTPIGDAIQQRIVERVGASDYDGEAPHSRPALIVGALRSLLGRGRIAADFSILDIACGDGIVLWQIRKAFPGAVCYGVDCHKGAFSAHEVIARAGVEVYRAFLQHLVVDDPDVPFDVVLMLNTYRGWDAADLRQHERDLPERVDRWLEKNARHVIVTATQSQLRLLSRLGWEVRRLGKGEDDSHMVCLSLEAGSESVAKAAWTRLRRSVFRVFR